MALEFLGNSTTGAKIREGDRVLIYLAGPVWREFVAGATIANDAENLVSGSEGKKILSVHGIDF